MKAVWTVISVVLLINAMIVAGAVGWLYHTGRLSRQRIEQARDVFELTIQQEQQQELQARELEEQSRERAMEIARLESVSDGPITLADRLRAEQRGDELAKQRVERLNRDIMDIRRQLDLGKSLLSKRQAQLDAERRAFEQSVQRQAKLRQDADFKQTVQMYQQVKPKQAKQMFQELIKQGKQSQVVDYLAAMQLRKAAAVLKTFKTSQEIVQATDLLQVLRQRGVELAAEGLDGS